MTVPRDGAFQNQMQGNRRGQSKRGRRQSLWTLTICAVDCGAYLGGTRHGVGLHRERPFWGKGNGAGSLAPLPLFLVVTSPSLGQNYRGDGEDNC